MYYAKVIRAMLAVTLLWGEALSYAGEKWPGVDEAVVRKFAREHGRDARELPFAPEGDLQLFMFLLAGAAGGFAAGYYWRVLTERRKSGSVDVNPPQ